MLPIHSIRSQILASLELQNRLVLTAPTGSGKTTQVPQFLLNAPFLSSPQILVLQPRRLAARLVATRVAAELNTPLGQLVGYQTRHDSRVSAATLIRFMTEGLFLRLLQSDPGLAGVGAVILDEFHERNLATDTALALVKLLQESPHPDLRLIVMSATLDTQLVSSYLQCPALEAHGRAFPVDIHYLDQRPTKRPVIGRIRRGGEEIPIWETAADTLADLFETESDGDILIFMPGGYEIRRTVELAQGLSSPDHPLSVFPLYSELPPKEQDEALAPNPHRKVIVSTNVAETSITIEGIRHVIDSGLARINRYDPKRGINVLAIEPISQASADQRAGRAGRTAPGTATRLWLQREHRHRPAHTTPEIRRLDLSEVLLQLKSMGIENVDSFPWLEAPDAQSVAEAHRILHLLGALGASDRLTEIGRAMSRLPMHPRLSRMLLEAARRGCLERAALWAALISDRDILVRGQKHSFADDLPTGPTSDFLVLERAFETARAMKFDPARCASRGASAMACREVEKTQRLYVDAAREVGLASASATDSRIPLAKASPTIHFPSSILTPLAESLLVSFPDHLAVRRNPTNLACALVGGRRAQLDPESISKNLPLLLPVEIREIGSGANAKTILSLVSEIDPAWLRAVHPGRFHRDMATQFNSQTQAVETIQRELFDDLVIDESSPRDADPLVAAPILAEQIFNGALKLDHWDESVEQWIARTRCVADWFPDRRLITYSDEERQLILEEICAGAVRHKDIKDRLCLDAVRNALSWDDQQFVEKMAPDRIQLPRGFRMKIEYAPGFSPRGRAKIQDFYGLDQTPTVAAGRQKVLLEILGPNYRPLQTTDDLAGFWQNLYPTLKKDLSRRYPRHEWR